MYTLYISVEDYGDAWSLDLTFFPPLRRLPAQRHNHQLPHTYSLHCSVHVAQCTHTSQILGALGWGTSPPNAPPPGGGRRRRVPLARLRMDRLVGSAGPSRSPRTIPAGSGAPFPECFRRPSLCVNGGYRIHTKPHPRQKKPHISEVREIRGPGNLCMKE